MRVFGIHCTRSALRRLQERIGELHEETETARTDLRVLHKERVRLEKEREVEKDEINRWNDRIQELQMLKFGRLIDLDELEQGTDRAKEEDASESIKRIEARHESQVKGLLKLKDELREEIANVSPT